MANDPTAPSTSTDSPQPSVEAGLPPEVPKFINLVRAQMRDFPELNRLISGVETSDRMIALCMMQTIDDFNLTPPLIEGYGITNFPSISLLVWGTIIYILMSVGILQVRNHLQYTDGQGIQVSVSDKAPQLMQWANMYQQMYEQKKLQLKKALNLKGALNGSAVPSEYRYISGLWDYYL